MYLDFNGKPAFLFVFMAPQAALKMNLVDSSLPPKWFLVTLGVCLSVSRPFGFGYEFLTPLARTILCLEATSS